MRRNTDYYEKPEDLGLVLYRREIPRELRHPMVPIEIAVVAVLPACGQIDRAKTCVLGKIGTNASSEMLTHVGQWKMEWGTEQVIDLLMSRVLELGGELER